MARLPRLACEEGGEYFMNQPVRVPIRFIARDGIVRDEPTGARDNPVVLAALPHTITPHESGRMHLDWSGPDNDWRVMWALIDTGADVTYIDSDMARRSGLPRHQALQVSGATGAIDSFSIWGHLSLCGTPGYIEAELLATPLYSNGRRYGAVLGMTTILANRLVIDGRRKEFYLELGIA